MTGQAAPRRTPGDARERILVAAELLFAKRGVDKTSTRDITTEAV
jgi:AcrR family transcriptional regulator